MIEQDYTALQALIKEYGIALLVDVLGQELIDLGQKKTGTRLLTVAMQVRDEEVEA